ncbi:hypothetical protein K491DRAFT_696336 [Lophiostoma macrostomum CBS 122681]|uniref:Heterokaryon incompatibility domain-containing protein n=1 Tax=Lophiostoma macrostomum CBS 122681 TaxID=1314788 RepID=A0A6A6SYJ9_9PLEO|nr:hypothetical protein K491DRAFT_696336 [Lophiostoma macrostomum CBS 122681]
MPKALYERVDPQKREIWILVVDERFPHWYTLIQAMDAIDGVRSHFEPFTRGLGGRSSGYHHAITLGSFRRSIEEDGCVTDEEFLFLHGRQCEATDSRDRIFGLVGLADEETRTSLVPDYELSDCEVFIMATKYLITRRNSLDVLSHCRLGVQKKDLPSWVVDLSTDLTVLPLRSRENQQVLYRCAGTTSPTARFQMYSDKEALCAQALLISTIAHPGLGCLEGKDDVLHDGTATHTTLELLEIWARTPDHNELGTIPTVLQSWFRTIIADQDDLGHRASEAYIHKSFPMPVETQQHLSSQLDLERINNACHNFCASNAVYSSHVLNRRIFVTANGLVGLGPRGLVVGDVVCVVYGCDVPLVS